MRKVISSTDFTSGLLFVLLGGAFFAVGLGYETGTARQMGPGYAPRLLSLAVIAIGAVQIAKAFLREAARSESMGSVHWRPALFILGGMAAFALLLRPAGLVIATLAAVGLSGLVAPDRRLREVALMAVVLSVFAALVFVRALGVVMPLWPRGF